MRPIFLLLFCLVLTTTTNAQWARPIESPGAIHDVQFTSTTEEHNYPNLRSDPSIHTLPARSFYASRLDWRHIIDSTWGPGVPLASKLAIFDSYAAALTNEFDGFLSLGLSKTSWDSLKSVFRSKIDSSISRGRFASLMARFAMRLRDAHTWAWDQGVIFSAPSPGVPLLILLPFAQADHFGAVLTALPDSTALVLRTLPNHPLGLEPGDIVLGYEDVPWKQLVRELLDAELPVFSAGYGVASAESHSFIRNVGNNWHLFETIDIVKHTTGDTLHLSVSPLLNLPSDPMMGSEQLAIPGIPFSFYRGWPFTPSGQLLASGRLPDANIGYIRLQGMMPASAADPLFAGAIDSLWNGDGLIIDLRWNPGGWSVFDAAFARMYSQRLYTLNDAYRASSSTFNLAPVEHSQYFLIPGVRGSIYDRPIAVLLGPTCVSMGDITAQRLRYHPMTRFFGKSSIASHGDNKDLTGYAGWWLHYSTSDMYHTSQPGVYLNRQEFPIDEPVWFTPDAVAQGIDPVLDRAVHWISTLSYARNVVLGGDTLTNMKDSVLVTARVKNPGRHNLVVSAIVTNTGGKTLDSLMLLPLPGDTLWAAHLGVSGSNGSYNISVRTDDVTSGSYRRLPDVGAFTVKTSIQAQTETLPKQFSLEQNYPNPFNPLTIIKYTVGGNRGWGVGISDVRLAVYDLLGREVAVLVNEKKAPGSYEVRFDGSRLASGMYIYRLTAGLPDRQAGSLVASHEMLLLR